jgi:ABC-type glutathione transport system ATPase component
MQEITLQIAGIRIQIKSSVTGIISRFKEFYHNFIIDEVVEIDYRINVIIEEFNLEFKNLENKGFNFQGYAYKSDTKKSTLIIPTIKNSYQYTEEFLLFLFSKLCIRKSKLIFHSATLIDEDDSAYVFFGPSGVGKTTISKKLIGYEVFSDDMVVLEKNNKEYILHKTPFERAKTYSKPKSVNIKGFYRLVQSKKLEKKRLDKGSAFNCFLSNLWFDNYEKNDLEPYLGIIKDIVNNIPVYELYSSKLTNQNEIITILNTNEKN